MPFAFVDLDLLDANAAGIVERARGKGVRIASKSLRSVPLLERIRGLHPAFRGVMCFSAAEAVFLSGRGLDDLLVAYPAWDEAAVASVCSELSRGRRIVLTIDCPEHVRRLGPLAKRSGTRLPVCLDVDMSSRLPGLHFGVRRSPVATVEQAVALAEAVRQEDSLVLDGMMGYEAQVAGLADDVPGQAVKSALVRWLKRRSVAEVSRRRAAIVRALTDRGHVLRFVNGGGTGSLETTAAEACVTEVTAGSGFYAPALFDGYRAFRHLPAAGFAIEITRRPAPGLYTCHGGGYVASGAAGPEKLPRPYLPPGARLLPAEGAGEVQTPIRYRGPERLELGDPVFLRHAKAGELCERFSTLLLVSQGRVVDEVATYRGDARCFL
jgi:D-serine deaminase-like pyridoxal phosphate-dependent protein